MESRKSKSSRKKPYARAFSPKFYKRKKYDDTRTDENYDEDDFTFSFYFSPPSRLLIKVKQFRDKPVVNLSKDNQFISLSQREFFDLMPMMEKIDEKLSLCKENILANLRRKIRRGTGGFGSGQPDFEQIQTSERSKKEAEDLTRLAEEEAKDSSGEESDE